MNYTEEKEQAELFYTKCIDTLVKKANDYASDKDCFSNFKFIAQVCDTSVDKVFLQFLAVKLARLSELVGKDKEAKNESIQDTLADMSNYACLFSLYKNYEKRESLNVTEYAKTIGY